MDRAKVQLSGEEMALVKDPGIILTKNSIIRKVVGLFALLNEEYQRIYGGDGLSEDGSPVRRISDGDSDHKKSWDSAKEGGRVGHVGGNSGKISKGGKL